jgi:rhodanese-related sulfurtransferase
MIGNSIGQKFAMALPAACLVFVASVALAGDPDVRPISQDAFLAMPKQGADAPFVLDVRSADEYVSGHVPGATNIPHDEVAARLAEVPKDRPVVLYCRSGRRSGLAAEVLAGQGYRQLRLLEGDMPAWIEKGRPVEKPKDPATCVADLKAGKPGTPACSGG